jgi:predicted MFS family arabinose efflux permease
VSAGGSFGQFAMIPLGQAFINAYGWAFALTLIALMAASMVLLAWTLAGDKGSQGDPGARASIPEALRCACAHSGFRWLNLGFFVCGFHITFIVSHLPAYLEDRGLSAEDGAIALSLIGLFNIIGSVICGFAGGRFAKKNVLSVMYFARSLVVLGLLMLPFGPMTAYVFAAAMGLLWLGTVPLTNGLVAQVFGPATVGTLFGVVFFSHQIGAFLGVWLGGYVFDTVGSYDMVWWIAIGLGVLAGIIHLPIDERPVVVAQTA